MSTPHPLTEERLAKLREHYERFDKHSPTAIELINEIERLRSLLSDPDNTDPSSDGGAA